MNRDVLSGSIDDGLTMNRYAYVNGNPISYIDPFGLSADSDEMLKTVGSFLADAVPGLGTLKGVQEVFTGMDYVTGQELSVGDRVASGVGTLFSFFPGGKVVGKTATKGAIDGGSWLIKHFGEEEAVEITLKYNNRFPKNEFSKKADALKQLGEQGSLCKAQNPVSRDPSITRAYRQDMIKRIWNQYGQSNPDFAKMLIQRVTERMQPDHIWELQLVGPDSINNLKFLDSYTNWHIGTQQIRPSIRKLLTGTKIKTSIEWGE